MITYMVKTEKLSSQADGCEPGAFQSIPLADEYAEIELGDEDETTETWTVKTSRDLSGILDQEDKVISYAEIDDPEV